MSRGVGPASDSKISGVVGSKESKRKAKAEQVADRVIDAIIFTPGRDDVEGSLGLGSVVAIVRVSSESKPHVYIICVFHCSEFAVYCSSDFLC